MKTREDEIRSRLEKATPGAWIVRKMRGEESNIGHGFVQAPRVDPSHGYDIEILCEDANYPDEKREGDLQLIAHAPSDLAYLLSRVEKMESVVKAAKNLRTRLAVTKDGYELLMRGKESLVPHLMKLATEVDALDAGKGDL